MTQDPENERDRAPICSHVAVFLLGHDSIGGSITNYSAATAAPPVCDSIPNDMLLMSVRWMIADGESLVKLNADVSNTFVLHPGPLGLEEAATP